MREIVRLTTEKATLTAVLMNESFIATRQLLKLVDAERTYALTGRIDDPNHEGGKVESMGWFTDSTELGSSTSMGDQLDSSATTPNLQKSRNFLSLLMRGSATSSVELDLEEALSLFQAMSQGKDPEARSNDRSDLGFKLVSKNLPKGAICARSQDDTDSSASSRTGRDRNQLLSFIALVSKVMAGVLQEVVALRNQCRAQQAVHATERGDLLLRIQTLRSKLRAARARGALTWAEQADGLIEDNDIDSADLGADNINPELGTSDAALARPSIAPPHAPQRPHSESPNPEELEAIRQRIDGELRAKVSNDDNDQTQAIASKIELESNYASHLTALYAKAVQRIAELEAERTAVEVRFQSLYEAKLADLRAELLRARTDATTEVTKLAQQHSESLRELSRAEAAARHENETLRSHVQAIEAELASLRTAAATAAEDRRKLSLAQAEKEDLRAQIVSLRRQLQASMQESRSPQIHQLVPPNATHLRTRVATQDSTRSDTTTPRATQREPLPVHDEIQVHVYSTEHEDEDEETEFDTESIRDTRHYRLQQSLSEVGSQFKLPLQSHDEQPDELEASQAPRFEQLRTPMRTSRPQSPAPGQAGRFMGSPQTRSQALQQHTRDVGSALGTVADEETDSEMGAESLLVPSVAPRSRAPSAARASAPPPRTLTDISTAQPGSSHVDSDDELSSNATQSPTRVWSHRIAVFPHQSDEDESVEGEI